MTITRRALKAFPFTKDRTPGGVRPTGTVSLTGGLSQSYEQIYKTQLWVSVVVNKLSRGIGRIPLKGYTRGANADRVLLKPGPGNWLANVLARPMPGVKSPFAWKEAIIGNLGLYGNCVVVKFRPRPGMPPTELWTSSFRNWEVKGGKTSTYEKYVFHVGGGLKLEFFPEDVIHFKWWGTGDDLVGQSPIEPLRRTLFVEDAAQRLQAASYENANRPSGMFVAPKGLEDNEVKRLQAVADALHGGVDKAFKLAVATGGVDWKPMSHTLIDSEVVETRKLNREEVAAAYDMPPPVIGILDKATFSNISEQHVMLYQDTMGAWVEMLEETLLEQLVYPERLMENQYVKFNLNAVLRGAMKERFEGLRMADWLTPNQKRELEDLDQIDDPRANMLWMPLNMMPIGEGALEMEERLARLQAAGATE